MHQLAITHFLNSIFGGVANSILHMVGLTPKSAEFPITDAVAMQLLVFTILIVYFLLVRMRLSADSPGAIQHVAEMIHEMVDTQAKGIIGHGHERYVPYALCVGVFILTCNLIGLIPGFASPTQFPYVPLGMAILTFVYYHYHGLREQGAWHYFLHFCGPVWWLIPLMLPIEIISHCARIMSLTIRLFANMFAGEMVTLAFFSLVPIGVPIIFLLLHIGVSVIQAFLFMLLTMIYVSLGVQHEEKHEAAH